MNVSHLFSGALQSTFGLAVCLLMGILWHYIFGVDLPEVSALLIACTVVLAPCYAAYNRYVAPKVEAWSLRS